MLYQFILNYVDSFGFLNVFKYITFRTGLSLFTSLIIVLIIGGPFINFFQIKILNPIRDDGPENHIVKNWYSYDGRGHYFIWTTSLSFMLGRLIKYKYYFLYLYCSIIWVTRSFG